MVLGAGDMIQAKQAKKRSLGAEKESGSVQGAPNKREKQWYEDLPLEDVVGDTSKNTKQQTASSARAASSAMDAQPKTPESSVADRVAMSDGCPDPKLEYSWAFDFTNDACTHLKAHLNPKQLERAQGAAGIYFRVVDADEQEMPVFKQMETAFVSGDVNVEHVPHVLQWIHVDEKYWCQPGRDESGWYIVTKYRCGSAKVHPVHTIRNGSIADAICMHGSHHRPSITCPCLYRTDHSSWESRPTPAI